MNEFDFLPERIATAVIIANHKYLSELRLRAGFPIIINCSNKYAYLSNEGITLNKKKAIICDVRDIEEIMMNITERSLYAFNDRLRHGFITTKKGIRIGIAGECVINEGQAVTIKNISSLNIRIPHKIEGCSAEIFNRTINLGLKSLLILSPPAQGKTTILKDLILKIDRKYAVPILIIDERGEFEDIKGENIDSVKYSDKLYAFNYALRSMSPRVIITDELMTEEDWKCAYSASNSGVKIIASCHAETIENLTRKDFFKQGIFDRYAFLQSEGEPGKIKAIYDENFNKL